MTSLDTPFATPTLAEIFIGQGHLSKGLAIYQTLLRTSPTNLEWQKRVSELTAELRRMEAGMVPAAAVKGSSPGGSAPLPVMDKPAGNDILTDFNQWLIAIRKRKEYVQENFESSR